MYRAVVIGGGWSGIAAALGAKKAGAEVTLLEKTDMLLGLGIMLAANEVPRIAQQFGLDSSVKVNMMSVVHATTTAVNLTRTVAKAAGK